MEGEREKECFKLIKERRTRRKDILMLKEKRIMIKQTQWEDENLIS